MTSTNATKSLEAVHTLNASDVEFAEMDHAGCCYADLSRATRGRGCVPGAFVCCQRCGQRWLKVCATWRPWAYGSGRPDGHAAR